MGIIANPADARAIAPVSRFVVLLSFGSADELLLAEPGIVPTPALARRERIAFRPPKYRAEPAPVRIAEGRVPRHSCLKGVVEDAISRRV